MSFEVATDGQWAERIRIAVAREVQELGISIVVIGLSRCVTLAGTVATDERRAQIAAIARLLLPAFEIRNDIAVIAMDPPRREEVA